VFSIDRPADEILISSERNADIRRQMGGAHYSYTLVEARFVELFRRLGYDTRTLSDPQRVKDRASGQFHVAFRSSENLRVVPGAHNICHFAWEFDVLRDASLPSDPILPNQAHMLGLFREIWAPSSYTLKVLRGVGLSQTVLVPTPVCETSPQPRLEARAILQLIGSLPAIPLRFSSEASEVENLELAQRGLCHLGQVPAIADRLAGGEGRIFLVVCNPGDLRKNLLNTIDGFRSVKRPGDVLLVKLVVANTGDHLIEAQHRYLRPLYRGPAAAADRDVYFVTHFLEYVQMQALYNLTDFYISASLCEGFNLPLLEAMAHGAVPVATTSTAMADYIFPDNSVKIGARPYIGIQTGMAGEVAGRPFVVQAPSRYDVASALRRAQQLTERERRDRGEVAAATVRRLYSYETVGRLVTERLAARPAERAA